MNRFTITIYLIAIAGTFLIMTWLVSLMREKTQPPPLGTARAEERRKAAADFQAGAVETLNNYGWVDQSRGLVRMPISNAVVLTLREAQNPAEARKKLVALAEKAAAPAPQAPAPPPPPNPFE